jgi:hypothetical protein
MTSERAHRGGRPRTQRRKDDPPVTMSLRVRNPQLAELDELAIAGTRVVGRGCARPSIGYSKA